MALRVIFVVLLSFLSHSVFGAALVSGVRMKIAAGDLLSGVAAVEDYKRDTGVDAEYLNAIGWLARGAEMLRRPDLAARYVAELKREIPEEKDDLLVPFGAAIEVESRLIHAARGRGDALRYLAGALEKAKDPSLRSRINKNIHLLSLEGQPAPPISMADYVGAKPDPNAMKGKVVLMYLWAQWCGDCKSQAPVLARVWERYRNKGLALVAPTRYYGSVDSKEVTPAVEKERVAKVWAETYAALEGVTAPIDDAGHIAYGASATPTFVLIDRKGRVRLYTPTRLSEDELVTRIEALLAE